MKPEIRRAALRAAAKAALVMSVGCSSAAPAAAPANTGPSAVAAVSCADHLGALATAKPDELAADDPLKDRPEVYGAFADIAARQSARTQECCAEALAADDGSSAPQRWECCSALPTPSAMACTPWGPPCPPTMV